MKWFSEFLKSNKTIVAGLCAAILVSVGVPIYLAAPLSDQTVQKISEEVDKQLAEQQLQEEKEERLKKQALEQPQPPAHQ